MECASLCHALILPTFMTTQIKLQALSFCFKMLMSALLELITVTMMPLVVTLLEDSTAHASNSLREMVHFVNVSYG